MALKNPSLFFYTYDSLPATDGMRILNAENCRYVTVIYGKPKQSICCILGRPEQVVDYTTKNRLADFIYYQQFKIVVGYRYLSQATERLKNLPSEYPGAAIAIINLLKRELGV